MANQKNFPKINSYLEIGFDKIKYMVLPSISLKRICHHTKITEIRPKISIIEIPKSIIIFSVCPKDNEARAKLKIMSNIQKKTIR
jgi:hypothetical protein